MELWTLIVKSNTHNFIILLILLFAIAKAIKLPEKIENAQDNIKNTIDNSQNEKEKSEKELLNAQKNLENIDDEIKKIFNQNEEDIKKLTGKIEIQTDNQISSIKENSEKLIDFEKTNAFNNLSKNTAIACIELAKKHIISVLKKKPEYHQKFVKESIQQLNGLKYNEK